MPDHQTEQSPASFPFPIEPGGFRLTMGLQAITPDAWLYPGPDRATQMAERQRLLAAQPQDVLACLWEAARAAGIILTMVAPDAEPATGISALQQLGHVAQEDFCILQRAEAADSYHLAGAVLCFPNRWRLTQKLGQAMAGIHAPVPAYGATLKRPVDRFFANLKSGRIVMRHNWSLHADRILFHPDSSSAAHDRAVDAVIPANAGDTVFMRVERQTLRRIDDAGHDTILFTIRTLIAPLGEAVDTPEKRRILDDTLATMPQDMQRYKSMARLIDPVRSWIMSGLV